MCPEGIAYSIIPTNNSSALALLGSRFQMPKKTAVNRTKKSLCPLRDHSGGETENEISSCVVCQAVIRVLEGEEGKRESGGGGVHF